LVGCSFLMAGGGAVSEEQAFQDYQPLTEPQFCAV
jgi:hypothetical protein